MNFTAQSILSASRPGRPAVGPVVGPCVGKVRGQPRCAPWALGLVALLLVGCGADPGGAGDSADAGVAAWGTDPGQAPGRAQATGQAAWADPADVQGEATAEAHAADGAPPPHQRAPNEGLLWGEPGELAVQALRVLVPAQPQPHYPRLLALLPAQARVGEVNEALNRARLRIDEMRPGNHSLVLVAAGSGMAAGELDQAAQRLQATGVFDRVMRLAAPVRAGIATQAVASVAAVDTVWDTDAAQCSDE
jgi:hypothetical protein